MITGIVFIRSSASPKHNIFHGLFFLHLSENMKHMYLRLYEVQIQNRLVTEDVVTHSCSLLPTLVQTAPKNLFRKAFWGNSNTCFGKNRLFQHKMSSSLRTLNILCCDGYHLAGYYCSSARVFPPTF